MGKGKNVPKIALSRTDKKQVRSIEAPLPANPSWRFSTVDQAGPFAWPKGKEEEQYILQKLHEFDSMQWGEIEGKQNHSIAVSRLSKEAQDRLSAINQDDVEEVFSFRLQGEHRVFGIRVRGVVKLLWWDPEHKVCPSNLKHT
jgi:hypothetical protein